MSGSTRALIDDVILGNANGAGEENRNVARMAALLAGFPVSVAGQTVNRLCGSGLQAVNTAAHAIMVGDGDVFVAGGVESMTRAPLVMLKPETAYERGARVARRHHPRLALRQPADRRAVRPESMGETGENVAERCDVIRADQDAFALESQQRAAAAIDDGRLAAQLVAGPVDAARMAR